MEFIKLQRYPYDSYSLMDGSNEKINLLGLFLSSDLGCPGTALDDWIFDDDQGTETRGNIMGLEKIDNYIYLHFLYEGKRKPTKFKISRQQLANLLYDWQEKVCKNNRPNNVTITYENDTFTIKTSD